MSMPLDERVENSMAAMSVLGVGLRRRLSKLARELKVAALERSLMARVIGAVGQAH
jgi:hypothetical protein